jgi:hypothetical protein
MKALILILSLAAVQPCFADLPSDIATIDGMNWNDGNKISKYDTAKTPTAYEALAALNKEGTEQSQCINTKNFIIKSGYEMDPTYVKQTFAKATRGVFAMVDEETIVYFPKNDAARKTQVTTFKKTLKRLLTSEENKIVVSSGYNAAGGDQPEGCSWYRYRIYKKDGTLVELNLDRTD